MTREEMEMRKLVRESDVIDKTDGTELARAFNHLWNKYIEQQPIDKLRAEIKKAIWEDVIVSLDGIDETRIPRLNLDDVLKIIDKYR